MKLPHKLTFGLMILALVLLTSASALGESHLSGKQTTDNVPWWERSALDGDKDGIFDSLEEKMSMGEEDHFNIIVDYRYAPGEEDVARLKDLGLVPSNVFRVFKAVGINHVPSDVIPKLLDLPGVVMIEEKGYFRAYGDIQTRAGKARPSEEYSPHTAWELGYKGKGVALAIMDTGVDNEHPSLKGKWLGGADVSKPEIPGLVPRDGTYDADDTNGHGTTCAGIAMGTGAPDGKYMGAAPEARLVDIRIGTIFGAAPGEGPQDIYDGTLQGIQWAMEHKDDKWKGAPDYEGIDLVSLSWGNYVGGSSDGTDVYSRALEEAIQSGLIFVGAAGNDGPSNDGFDGLAAADSTISVGALDDRNTVNRSDDMIAYYSSRGPRKDDGDGYPYDELKPDVTASGTDIIQAEFDRIGDGSGNGYGPRGSGTSYATPSVAGTVALMLSANSDLDRETIREILHITAERKGRPTLPDIDPVWNKDYGWGMLDAYNAVRLSLEIKDEMDEIDTNLQAVFLNTSWNGTSGANITGVVWAKRGNVEDFSVEVRIDGGDWKEAELLPTDHERYITFSFDPGALTLGEHEVEVRSLSGGKHSLPALSILNVDSELAVNIPAGGAGVLFWSLLIFFGAGAAGLFFYVKKGK